MNRKFGIVIVVGVLGTMLAAAIDPVQQLGIKTEDAQRYVLESISYGNLSYPGTARTVAPSLRVDVAKGITEFAKSYTQTTLFKTQYSDWWKGIEPQKPATLEERAKETEERTAQDKAAGDETIANMKKQINDTKDPAMKKALEEALKQYDAMKKQMESPEMKATMDQSAIAQKKELEEDTKRDLGNYNKEHTEWLAKKDPNLVIKKLLQQYLTLVNTVDFNAATHKNSYGQIVFTDPANEGKSSDWKMCFRAGKGVNAVTKNFAQRWLAELK
jgi:hypothetical protein